MPKALRRWSLVLALVALPGTGAFSDPAGGGLGVPMLFAFVIGLLISNFVIVVFSSVGFVSSQARERVYVGIGAVAGVFSLAIGLVFITGQDAILPDLGAILPF